MILLGQYDSPFVRRVAIALHHYELPFEHRPWSVWADAAKISPSTIRYAACRRCCSRRRQRASRDVRHLGRAG